MIDASTALLVCWLGATATAPKLVADATPIDHGLLVTHRPPYSTQTELTIPCAVRWSLVGLATEPATEPALQLTCYDHLGNPVLRDTANSVSHPTPGTTAWDDPYGDGHTLTNLECVIDQVSP